MLGTAGSAPDCFRYCRGFFFLEYGGKPRGRHS
jgi:hypothetical protein